MGVPAFFRYLTQKYGQILVDAAEVAASEVNGESMGVDTDLANPNGAARAVRAEMQQRLCPAL